VKRARMAVEMEEATHERLTGLEEVVTAGGDGSSVVCSSTAADEPQPRLTSLEHVPVPVPVPVPVSEATVVVRASPEATVVVRASPRAAIRSSVRLMQLQSARMG
jgi:hypothetical protein